MGWDTEVILIAEQFDLKQDALDAIMLFHQEDGGRWEKPSCYLIEENGRFNFYFHYERRKATPFWVVQPMSEKWLKTSFTLLGSCPDFLAGPGGIARISTGEIVDRYGIYDQWEPKSRQLVLYEPAQYAQLIFHWFRVGGPEASIRATWEKNFPKDWCDTDYAEKLIPISADERFKEQLAFYDQDVNPDWLEVELPQWKK